MQNHDTHPLKTQETQGDPHDRKRWKWAFTRRRYATGLGRNDVIRLYPFIEWLMWLPPELQADYWKDIAMYEQEQSTTFITYAEQIGHARGFQEGIQQGIEQGIEQGKREGLLAAIELGLELKFGREGLTLLPRIAQITEVEGLQQVYAALRQDVSLKGLKDFYG